MSIRSKGFVFAMEEGEVVDPVVTDEVPAIQAEVEAGSAEVVEEAEEIQEGIEAADEAGEDGETLGDIQEVMAESVEKGEGLDETSAAIAEVAVEAICARLGISGKHLMPATESFGSSNSRLAATKIAMENVGETIKRILEGIKKFFAGLWEKIKAFYTNFFGNSEKVEKLAKEMQAKVEGLDKAAEAKAGEFKSGAIAGALNDGSKVDGGTAKAVVEAQAKLTADFDKVVGGFVSISEGVRKMAADIGKVGVGDIMSGFKAVEATGLVGGQTLTVGVKPDTATVSTSIEAKSFDKDMVKTLDRAEMVELCKAVGGLMAETTKIKKELPKIEKSNKDLSTAVDAVIKFVDNKAEKVEASKAAIDAIRSVSTSSQSACSKFVTFVPVANLKAGKAALNYVSASLKQYGAKTEAAAPAEAK